MGEVTGILEMLKKIEINFWALYEKREKVDYAPKAD